MWTLVVWQLATIGRASLFTDFCPNVEQITLPAETHQYDADGMPQFIMLRLHRWKGNSGHLTQVRAGRGSGAAHARAALGWRHVHACAVCGVW